MLPLRFARRAVVCGWLVCQVAALVTAPIALARVSADELSSAHDESCCPGVAPGQVCPMHHTREGHRTCAMTSACSGRDAALLTVFGTVGVIAPAVDTVPVIVSLGAVRNAIASLAGPLEFPPSPPPRL